MIMDCDLEKAAMNLNLKTSDLVVLLKAVLHYESNLARLSADSSYFQPDVDELVAFKKKFSFLFEFDWLKSYVRTNSSNRYSCKS